MRRIATASTTIAALTRAATDAGALLAACLAGHGIAQPLELHARPHLDAGRLVRLLPDWAKERFPLFAATGRPSVWPGCRAAPGE